jgi:hypothetical protein
MNIDYRRYTILASLLFIISGCSISERFSKNLTGAVLNNDDIQTIADGLPAYLILIDSMLEDDPEDEDMLRTSASLTNAYAGVFVTSPERQRKLVAKALRLASRAICLHKEESCNIQSQKYDQVQSIISNMDEDDLSMLYTLGVAWASWIQANTENWNAIAQIAQVKLIMSKVLELNENYQNAGAHLYMGVLNSILPPAMGGKPELGKQHFEKAISLSNNKNLMAKVLYAQHYSRLIYDQQLHDKLLKEVLAAKPEVKGMTLSNTVAQKQAKELLASSNDFF